MKGELEDLSFQYVYPKEYQRVKAIRDEKLAGKESYFEKIIGKTKNQLQQAGVKTVNVYGRSKRLYSLYQKLIRKDNEITNVYDTFAIRIIVPTVADCYASLGILHTLWKPLKGRIKDYISQPKPNGYQSLHTTVFSEGGEIVEFQIRTQKMHDEAEYGVAAHWHYDEFGSRLPKREIKWAKELAEIQKDILNKLSDLEEMKVDFLQTRIFVFTPKGDVIDLPEGATAVDFAYHIHSDVGDKCTGVMINDKMGKLDSELKNGDVVEVITDKNRKGPSQDWLQFVKTHTAKTQIKSNIKEQNNSTISKLLKAMLPRK